MSSAPRPPQAARCKGERPLHKHTHAQTRCNSILLYTPPFSFTIWPLYEFCSPGASYVGTIAKANHLRMPSWTHRLGCMKQTSHESGYNYMQSFVLAMQTFSVNSIKLQNTETLWKMSKYGSVCFYEPRMYLNTFSHEFEQLNNEMNNMLQKWSKQAHTNCKVVFLSHINVNEHQWPQACNVHRRMRCIKCTWIVYTALAFSLRSKRCQIGLLIQCSSHVMIPLVTWP